MSLEVSVWKAVKIVATFLFYAEKYFNLDDDWIFSRFNKDGVDDGGKRISMRGSSISMDNEHDDFYVVGNGWFGRRDEGE